MRYRITFAHERVGQSHIAPFEIETPEHLGVAARTGDIARRVRGHVVDALTSAPAPGASDARPVIEEHTQIMVILGAGEGAAYYGTTTLGQFSIYPIA